MCYRKYADSTIRRNAPAQYKYLLKVQDKAFEHPNMPEAFAGKAVSGPAIFRSAGSFGTFLAIRVCG